jgi:hypothetical protein
VKEPRLAVISTVAGANGFPEKTYLPKMNQKFSIPAAEPEDARVPPGSVNLKDITRLQYERTIANNFVVRFETRLFQILKTNKALPRTGDKVTIRVAPDGNLTVLWKDTELPVKELTNTQGPKNQKAA